MGSTLEMEPVACDFSELSAYLDNELSDTERRRIENHMNECAACAEEFAELERVKSLLLSYATPARLHSNLMTRVRAEEPEPLPAALPPPVRRTWPVAIAALLAATLMVGGLWFGAKALLDSQPQQDATRLAQVSAEPRAVSPEPEAAPPVEAKADPGPAPKKATKAVEPPEREAVTPETLPLALAGTIQGTSAQAIIVTTDTGRQGTYKVGATILPGVRLTRVDKNSVEIDNRGKAETLAMGERALSAPAVSLEGPWRMMIYAGETVFSSNDVAMVAEGGRLEVRFEGDKSIPPLRGTLSGQQASLDWDRGIDVWKLTGSFNADFTKLELGAEVSQPGASDEVRPVRVSLERQSPDMLKAEDERQLALRRQREEVEQLYDPIRRYAADSDGRFPETLAELAPAYIENADQYRSDDVRTIQYTPGGVVPGAAALADAVPKKDLPMPMRLEAWASALQRLWDKPAPLFSPVLAVTYVEPARRYVVDAAGIVRDFGDLEPGQEAKAEVLSNQRLASQKNLRQIGLAIKLFVNENELYTPPGWLPLYPDYLSDTSVLTAPWDNPGTLSYEYLLPSRPEDSLIELGEKHVEAARQLDRNNPARIPLIMSQVPLVTEKDTVPEVEGVPRGRNVLFLDGHVEFLNDEAWEAKVTPFL